MKANKKCPGGKYCYGGLQSETEAQNCAKGHYCPEATDRMIPCPVGTYNEAEEGPDIDACKPCTAGFYCEEQTVTPTLKCEKGYYCPTNITDGVSSRIIGSYGKYQSPCPASTYTNVVGTEKKEDCIPCDVGRYCPQGTDNPKACPRGYYCPPESSTPLPCPIGTYGSESNLEYRENCTDCDPGW